MNAAPPGGRCGTHARKASCRDPIGPDDMTITPNTDEHATRVADLETQYLIALMQRDARVFAERAEARDAIVAREAPTVTTNDHGLPLMRQSPQLPIPFPSWTYHACR